MNPENKNRRITKNTNNLNSIYRNNIVNYSTLIFLTIITMITLTFIPEATSQYNYDHVNVTARANVTSSLPTILEVVVDQDITLNAGTTIEVYCNATVRDWNGHNDIVNANATLYYFLNQSNHPDDNDVHYTNTSCQKTGDDGEYIGYYECGFDVYFHANNGSWICNVSVNDTYGFIDSLTNTTTINALYALNVTDVIDYGELAVTETSDNVTATITNFGNTNINVSVLGYGTTEGDGIGLVCTTGSNISVENQRFSGYNVSWTNKIELAATNQDMNLTLVKPTNASPSITWNTFWQLYVPPNPFGLCEGTIRFTATAI